MHLAIDPSVNNLGIAFHNPDTGEYEWKLIIPEGRRIEQKLADIQLQIARFLRYRSCTFDGITLLVCEYPKFFNSEKGGVAAVMGFTNDLACICGYMAAVCKFAKLHFYYPHQWKGNLTKHAIEFRFKRLFGEQVSLPSEHEQEATVMLYRHNSGTLGGDS